MLGVKYLVIGLSLAVLLGASHYKAYSSGKKSVMAEWQIEKTRQAEELAAAIQKTRDTERKMQYVADRLQEEKRNEIATISRKHRTIVDGLLDSHSRLIAAVPSDSRYAQAGREREETIIPRSLAEYLFDEALRADTIRVELEACYAQYDEVRNGNSLR